MTDQTEHHDCFGHRAATELLKSARLVLAEQDFANPGTIQMALQALDSAQKWLMRCAECRVGRNLGEEPLCGPLPAEA